MAGTALDATALRVEVLDVLRRGVGFDAHAWVLTDPVTTVGGAPHAELPALDGLPELIRTRYQVPELRRSGGGAVRLSALPPGAARSWRDVLAGYGATDVVSTTLDDRFGSWAFLDLWRCGGGFTSAEAALLDDLRPALAAAVRRCQAQDLSTPGDERTDRGTDERDGPAVVVLDDRLLAEAETVSAQRWLTQLLPPPGDRPPVPAVVYNVAAQLLAREAGVDEHAASTRCSLGSGRWLTVSAARLVAEASITVTLEPLPALERLDLYVRAYGLSPREVEIVELLAGGLDTADVARRLNLSQHTVQDHLKGAFARTGTRSRRALVAAALGVRAVA